MRSAKRVITGSLVILLFAILVILTVNKDSILFRAGGASRTWRSAVRRRG